MRARPRVVAARYEISEQRILTHPLRPHDAERRISEEKHDIEEEYFDSVQNGYGGGRAKGQAD